MFRVIEHLLWCPWVGTGTLWQGGWGQMYGPQGARGSGGSSYPCHAPSTDDDREGGHYGGVPAGLEVSVVFSQEEKGQGAT